MADDDILSNESHFINPSNIGNNLNDMGSSIATNARKVIIRNAYQSYDVPYLKQSLEGWKLLLLPLNNLIEWEHKFAPVFILFLDTFIFGLLMYYNPSMLTTIAIIGLVLLVLESAVPVITGYFFKTTDWDPVSESKYTRICERISNLHKHIINLKTRLDNIRREKQPLYFLIVFFFLIFCAYVGQSVDNFLLTYLAVLVITLAPGARRHNLAQKIINRIKATVGMGGGSGAAHTSRRINTSLSSSSVYDSNKRK